jgi:allantoin racemase
MGTLRIRAITPIHVGTDELARRQARYDLFSPDGLTVTLEDLPDDASVPRQLASVEDIDASNRTVARMAMDTDPEEFDLVMPDCVLDTGLTQLRAVTTPVPVVGLSEIAAGYIRGLGLRLAAVTRNTQLAGVEDLGLSFEDIADDVRWSGALEEARIRIQANGGADAILNGCSAVDVTVGEGIPVFDPTRLALRLLALAADESLVGAR